MKTFITYALLLLCLSSYIQAKTIDGINPTSFESVKGTYNYTYWDQNLLEETSKRSFTNLTNAYKLNINYTELSINDLSINNEKWSASEAFSKTKAEAFPNYHKGNITYKILQDGKVIHEKPNENPTNWGQKIGQMVEYGPWINRRVIDSLNYTGNLKVRTSYSGIEFVNWHNRFMITFHLMPLENIDNAQIQLTVDMPKQYKPSLNGKNTYAFTDGQQGFSVRGGITAEETQIEGQSITVTTTADNLQSHKAYEVSLIFYAIKDDIKNKYITCHQQEKGAIVRATQSQPDTKGEVIVDYKNDEGIYFVNIPSYKMGYGSKSTIDLMQNIKLELINEQKTDRIVRLSFRDEDPKNVVGFTSMLRNSEGEPTGFPLQISKNWHNGFKMLCSGHWIHEYTELVVPANTTLKIDYTRVGARWGKVFGAFSHQLCVVGAGVPRGGWLEAGMGSFGENITHSPDYEYGQANICDYRPFLTTNKSIGGTSKAYNWTGNLGGMDLFVYVNDKGERIYPSEVSTHFHRYGPNLTETSVSSVSADKALKLDYTFYLNRSDDFLRVYYKIKVKALKDTKFDRFDIFQLGHDSYTLLKAQSIVYGNMEGKIAAFTPKNARGYTTKAIPLEGHTPWLWAGDGIRHRNNGWGTQNKYIDANNAFIIRNYKSSFDGQENNTPYFREHVIQSARTKSFIPSYCIVTPEDVTSFTKGDEIELLLELCLMPKTVIDYYGPNGAFKQALKNYGNSWKMLYREVTGNGVHNTYPLTFSDKAGDVDGGVAYVPLVFEGITKPDAPKLYEVDGRTKTLIDQSNYGNDFWQVDFNTETGLFDVIYNVNHDSNKKVYKYVLENNNN